MFGQLHPSHASIKIDLLTIGRVLCKGAMGVKPMCEGKKEQMKEREGEIDPLLSSALIAIHHFIRQAFALF